MLNLLYILLILVPSALSFRFSFDIKYGESRCFSEYLTRNTHVKGFIQVAISLVPHFSLKIKDEEDNLYFEHEYDQENTEKELSNLIEDYKKKFGKDVHPDEIENMVWNEHNGLTNRINFAFASLSNSAHYFCIKNQNKEDSHFEFQLLTGIDANDYNQLIKVKHVEPVMAKVIALNDYIKKMKRDEENMWIKEAGKSTLEHNFNFSLVWTSLLTMLMIAAISVVQYYNLKRVFKEKKLI